MYSRKLALTLAKQYRTCPATVVRDDQSQRQAYEQHLSLCPYCSMQKVEEREAWIALSRKLEFLFEDDKKHGEPGKVYPGQFRFLRKDLAIWRKDLFYNPPMVLVLENTGVISDDVLVSQIYHDISLAGPGDLILKEPHTSLVDLFIESWNIYTLKGADLGESFGTVTPEIIQAVKSLEIEPDSYPDWAILPRPFAQNDPRIYFRELEIEVGYTFAVRSVSELMEEAEAPRLRLAYTSVKATRDAVHNTVPGARWQREPLTHEEALALAEFPQDRLPLAAADQTRERITANFIRIKDGAVQAFDPLELEIYGRSGTLTISGRILGLPASIKGSTLICFLDVGARTPLSPAKYEWREETGDFIVEFQMEKGLEGGLRAAVAYETIRG